MSGHPNPKPAGAPPPTSEEIAHFVDTAQRYGHWLGTPEENAAVGITLPDFTSSQRPEN